MLFTKYIVIRVYASISSFLTANGRWTHGLQAPACCCAESVPTHKPPIRRERIFLKSRAILALIRFLFQLPTQSDISGQEEDRQAFRSRQHGIHVVYTARGNDG
jgi:hypothetical protein